MNNLLKRFFSGAIYVAVLIWASSNPIYIGVLFMLVGIIGTIELKKILDKQNILIDIWPVLILGISGYISVIYPDKKGIIILGILIYTIGIIFYANSKSIRKIGSTLFCISYIFIPLALAIPIAESNNTYESNTLTGLFILIWASDSWAYILGKLLGRRKLFEKISPNKTLEGFLG
jgi:phosphatidate cytidylyltransferase